VIRRTLVACNNACCSLPSGSLTVWCVVCMLLLCMSSFAAGKAAAVVAPRAVSRARCVRPYSLFGGLFGAKTADMGSTASKGGREGWAPSTGGHIFACSTAAVAVLVYCLIINRKCSQASMSVHNSWLQPWHPVVAVGVEKSVAVYEH
jgi:hypothetical protein